MQRVYTAQSLIDAQLVLDHLAQAGVPSMLFNQNALGGLGDLPVVEPEVWVKHDRDAAEARRVIHLLINRPPPPSDKTCDTCAEPNPATFDICWQCSAPLADPV